MERITPGTGIYIEFDKTQIILFTEHGSSVYPVWLGKNRATMKKAIATLRTSPPETLITFLEFISNYRLTGLIGSFPVQKNLLKYRDKSLDKPQTFY